MKKRFIIRAAVFALVLAVALAPALLLTLEACHRCDHTDCDICKTIALCRNIIRSALCRFIALVLIFAMFSGAYTAIKTALRAGEKTPVALKVKLTN